MKLGIKGHETRGDEIIKILEMLGGKNHHEMSGGIYDKYFYYIDDEYKDISYSYIGPYEIKGYEIFSLEDFLEKFPYKVGDKVNVWVNYDHFSGPRAELEEAEIKSMRWNSARCQIAYKMKDINREFYIEDIKGKIDDKTTKDMEEKKINQMSLANCDLDEVEIVLGDRFKLKIIDGKYYAVRKKPTYPKTYEECWKVFDLKHNLSLWWNAYDAHFGIVSKLPKELLGIKENIESLSKLLVCRNVYWKLYGEEIGLDGSWEPDWNDNNQPKFGIYNVQNDIRTINLRVLKNLILVFPTEEMRDAFYGNFKDLIEICKELL